MWLLLRLRVLLVLPLLLVLLLLFVVAALQLAVQFSSSALGQNLLRCLAKAFNFPRTAAAAQLSLHYSPVPVVVLLLLLCLKVLQANTHTHTGTPAHTPTHTRRKLIAAVFGAYLSLKFVSWMFQLVLRFLCVVLGPWTTTWAFNLLLPLPPLPLFLLFCAALFCLPLAYLLFKFNLHYLKNLKSKNFSCANRRRRGRSK